MALLSCYECGAQISSLAPACPHCGAPAVRNEDKVSVAQTVASDPGEREILREGGVLVTSRRFVVGQTTCATRGVTSVAMARESVSGTSIGTGWIICGLILLVTGIVVLLRALAEATSSTALVAEGFVVAGALSAYKGNSDSKAPQAFQFVVRMRSASGEQQVYVSRDEAHVRRIVAALTAALST